MQSCLTLAAGIRYNFFTGRSSVIDEGLLSDTPSKHLEQSSPEIPLG